MPVSATPDEAGVRGVEEAYDRSWCAGDLGALMACISADAVLVNPRGEAAVGKDAIRRVLGRLLQGEAAGSRHQSHLERVSFARGDVAVVDGWAEVSGGGLERPMRHRFTDVLVREDGGWLILHVRAYALEEGSAGG